MLWKLFNRRKDDRFYVQENTYLVFQSDTNDEKIFRIIDISEGGCGFIYQGDEKELEKIGSIDLMSDDIQHLTQIPVTTANDRPAEFPFRRRGVEFRWLGYVNEEKLKDFIRKVSLFKAE